MSDLMIADLDKIVGTTPRFLLGVTCAAALFEKVTFEKCVSVYTTGPRVCVFGCSRS